MLLVSKTLSLGLAVPDQSVRRVKVRNLVIRALAVLPVSGNGVCCLQIHFVHTPL